MNDEQNITDIELLKAVVRAYEEKTRRKASEYGDDEFQDGVTTGELSAISAFKRMIRGIKLNDDK